MSKSTFAEETTKQFLKILSPDQLLKKWILWENKKKSLIHLTGNLEDLNEYRKVFLIGVGKAASAHVHEAQKIITIDSLECVSLTKRGHTLSDKQMKQFEADHPIPTAQGLQAASDFIQYLETKTQDEDLCLFFISGGGSALLEKLSDDYSFDELINLTQKGLIDGSSIHELNEKRKQKSQVKNGGLLNFVNLKKAYAFYVSDVPGNAVSSIASSPLMGPKAPQEKQARLKHQVICSPENVMTLWQDMNSDLKAHYIRTWDIPFSQMLKKTLQDCMSLKTGELFLYGGEAPVEIPPHVHAGRGGRNTHFVAALACFVFDSDDFPQIDFIYSLASDGGDGPFDFAGAWITRELYYDALSRGILAKDYVERYDSASYFEKIGSLIKTGPTGSNVMDLRMVGSCPI